MVIVLVPMCALLLLVNSCQCLTVIETQMLASLVKHLQVGFCVFVETSPGLISAESVKQLSRSQVFAGYVGVNELIRSLNRNLRLPQKRWILYSEPRKTAVVWKINSSLLSFHIKKVWQSKSRCIVK